MLVSQQVYHAHENRCSASESEVTAKPSMSQSILHDIQRTIYYRRLGMLFIYASTVRP